MQHVAWMTVGMAFAVALGVGCGGDGTNGPGGAGSSTSSTAGNGGTGGAGSSSSTSSASSSSSGSSSSGGPVCQVADDCPATGTACLVRTCSAGVCGTQPAPTGTGCTDDNGKVCNGAGQCVQCFEASTCPGTDTDCQVRTCDAGKCGFFYTLAGAPTATQTPGDCKKTKCDGVGGIVTENDDADIPSGSECAVGACASGTPTITPLANGTVCTTGGKLCQAGACVPFLPVTCKTSKGTYVGCDGMTHVEYNDISFTSSSMGYVQCFSHPSSTVAYCAPGTSCTVWFTSGSPGFEIGTCQ